MVLDSLSEADIARIWAHEALPGVPLTLVSGAHWRVIYSGRPNQGAGPDFQDAVLLDETGRRRHGDIEIHRRASDWRHHGHHRDPRYSRVLLHVVSIRDDGPDTPLPGGDCAPVLVLTGHLPGPDISPAGNSCCWPCQDTRTRPAPEALDALLFAAGMARFAERVVRFRAELCAAPALTGWAAEDAVLIPAVAEGLGYGRDRTSFRQAALALLTRPAACTCTCAGSGLSATKTALHCKGCEGYRGNTAALLAMFVPFADATDPEAATGNKAHRKELRQLRGDPSQSAVGEYRKFADCIGLDVQRSAGLVILIDRWQHAGLWPYCHAVLLGNPPTVAREALERALQVRIPGARTALISRARAAIIVCNVVLPFAAAIGALTDERALVDAASACYCTYPGLTNNRVTRAMAAQLHLDAPPRGAIRQQGLHHLYRHFCAAKLCGDCPCGGNRPGDRMPMPAASLPGSRLASVT